MRRKAPAKKSKQPKTGKRQHVFTAEDLLRVEYHRSALALLPEVDDKAPGVAIEVFAAEGVTPQRFCTCNTSQSKTCRHLRQLSQLPKAFPKLFKKPPFTDIFHAGIWYRLAVLLAAGCNETPQSIRLVSATDQDLGAIAVLDTKKQPLMYYVSQGADGSRFIERCAADAQSWDPEHDVEDEVAAIIEDTVIPHRSVILDRLSSLTLSSNERHALAMGVQTRGLAVTRSVWYRIMYHCHREFDAGQCRFVPAIDETTGLFRLTVQDDSGAPLMHLNIPRVKVPRLISGFKDILRNQNNLAIHPIPLKSIFKVSMNTELDLDVRPVIKMIQDDGEARFFEREDLKRFTYGNLVYIKDLGIMAEMEPAGSRTKYVAPRKMVFKKYQIENFFDTYGDDLDTDNLIVDQSARSLKIIDRVDACNILPHAGDRDWYWLSADYQVADETVSLGDVLNAQKNGQRFIGTPDGWLDCRGSLFEGLKPLLRLTSDEADPDQAKGQFKLSRLDLFRLQATGAWPLEIRGEDALATELKDLLALKPHTPMETVEGLKSTLRPYQSIGAQWLRFLSENGFGGLLCDDMGLGKTHQVMALMLSMTADKDAGAPFLVVCPTTVLSHWESKLRCFAPDLPSATFHGSQRDLDTMLDQAQVLLTSYGIMRRDRDLLARKRFALVVFDEIQYLKNDATKAYRAAQTLDAGLKVGLTGTPIENRIDELKALMDLVLPGYLGSTEAFRQRYAAAIDADLNGRRRQELSRLITPFTLRRLKSTVLDELPPKIEDLRTCRLSEAQVKLYRDAVESKGRALHQSLQNDSEPVPYLHIFALLTLLKQICNHPALLVDQGAGPEINPETHQTDDPLRLESGKWELFCELLDEALAAGQKVVVYSQYVKMIDIIAAHLQRLDVGHVVLTGASRKRGNLIVRFNEEPDCRVFVGSLIAGGTGIDLVAASVVIHYDRWWNAAKEDQATDRVHRIGQRRGVQVFKLVTEGTLEEKIAAIIDQKKKLMESVVQEDDPGLLKNFSKEELLELLAAPAEA